MKAHFEESKGLLVAEPLYLLLSFYNHPNGHETVRQLTLKARAQGKGLQELIPQEKELQPYLKKFTAKQKDMLLHPEKYTGKAAEKTQKVCAYWKKQLKL
jgi:adenylosuccinate lyase